MARQADAAQEFLARAIRSVINPDKLRYLGPVADVYGLLRQQRQSS